MEWSPSPVAAPAGEEAVVRVAEIPGKGRGLVASRAIRGGEIILSDSPILIYTADAASSSSSPPTTVYCSHCFRSLSSSSSSSSSSSAPLPCECDHGALFCSPACLASHSPWLCAALARLPSSAQSEARFLLAAHSLSPSDFRRLLSLSAPAPAPPEEALALAALLSSLSLPPSPSGFPLADPALTSALLSIDARNAFALMEPSSCNGEERRVRAYGIYPAASLFNHDCLPNACRFDCPDLGPHMAVRAIHDIPQVRELFLSYFPVNWGYRERQRRLRDDFGFDCRCDRCEVEKNWKDQDEDQNQDQEADNMEEEEDEDDDNVDHQGGIGTEEEGEDGDTDFPHAYFFMRFMCDSDKCGGTLAPLPPSLQGTPAHLMECNACGKLRAEEDAGRGSISE